MNFSIVNNIEINELGAEVRQVKLCQFHLFFACFTISMALASFLAVLYQLGASTSLKSLVAIGPAVISVVFGILSIQKTIQRNRIESFILHLLTIE
jgi:hypothetical protein